MKSLIIILLFYLGSFTLSAQYYTKTASNNNFELSVKRIEQQYKDKDKGRGSGYKQFKRWEKFVQKRLDVNGNRVNNTSLSFRAFNHLKKNKGSRGDRSNGHWTELGPSAWTNNPDPYPDSDQGGYNPGNGRINEIAFHPTNANIIYVGASGGGLWKTMDGGASWSSLTDGMPDLAVSGIAVSHSNPDVIYILTGDGDSWDLMSIGVLKTTDGGLSWQQTGLIFGRDDLIVGTELKMDPFNSNVLIATTSDGIYKTINAGETWYKVKDGSFYDIEYNPANSDTIYASTKIAIFRSVDHGESWQEKKDLSTYTNNDDHPRIELAVTPDNCNKVYAVLGDKNSYLGVFISDDCGDTWVRHYDDMSPNILGGDADGSSNKTQAWYDLAIAVSPVNENRIFVGGINIWWSFDSGDHWSITSHWRQDWDEYEYVHADIHELIFNNSILYAGCDGGIFKSTNSGLVWTDISEGLGIMQPHKIGIINTNTDLVYMGTQDNGVNKFSGSTTVDNVRGADGFECIIMPSNSDTVFCSTQFGTIEMSIDGGNTFSVIKIGTTYNLFNNPLLMRPGINNRLIYPSKSKISILRFDSTVAFVKHIPSSQLQFVSHIDISSYNDDILIASLMGYNGFFSSSDSLWLTDDLFDQLNNNWINITNNLPLDAFTISDVAIDPINNHHLIVSFNGYIDGDKVFESWDRGANWSNISYNLENVPVNCIAIDPGVLDAIYIGTDLGVFYLDPGASEWIYYSNGLPPVIIQELEINTVNNIIYAATYGRGLWKSELYTGCATAFSLTADNDPSNPDYTGVQIYEASNYIISTRTITGGFGTDVSYKAGNYIDLKPGFRAVQGNLFEAVIGSCGPITNSEPDKIKEETVPEDK